MSLLRDTKGQGRARGLYDEQLQRQKQEKAARARHAARRAGLFFPAPVDPSPVEPDTEA